ncbi:MAG: Rieske (2Fe-2S) protein [Pseudomonadota bacterium]
MSTAFDPPAPPPGARLCALDDIPAPGAKEFDFKDGQKWFAMFVVRDAGDVRGYVNICPHAGRPLNYGPDAFLTPDKTHILCAAHGAVFQIDDGMCIAGPCLGRRLIPFPVSIKAGDVIVAAPQMKPR